MQIAPTNKCLSHLIILLAMGALCLASPASGQVVFENQIVHSPNTTPPPGTYFGTSVSIDNGVVAVNEGDTVNIGTVYLYDVMTGTEILTVPSPFGLRTFGRAIDLDNGLLAVGASDSIGDLDFYGRAFLFDATSGALIRELISGETSDFNLFATAIAMDNGIVAVGDTSVSAPDPGQFGAVFLFDVSTGALLHKLTASDPLWQGILGDSVDMDDGIVVVGAPYGASGGVDMGAAFLFDAVTGAQLHRLVPVNQGAADQFGTSVSIHDGLVIVGAPRNSQQSTYSGAVYIFDAATGQQIHQLVFIDPNVSNSDLFGQSVSIDDGVAIVGAPGAPGVYRYNASTGGQIDELAPMSGTDNLNEFGNAVAIQNHRVGVGDRHEQSVYLYNFSCPSDINGDGELDFLDISAFLDAYNTQNPIADLNHDTFFDFLDISAFLSQYTNGCP